MTPGQIENARADIEAAREALRAAELALGEDLRRDAASRAYYACFHAARATLTVAGLSAKTHSGLIQLFGRTHQPEPLLDRLLELRGEADYSMQTFRATTEAIEELLEQARAFVERCAEVVEQETRDGANEPDPSADT